MVIGVTEGFTKKLQLVGVGYRAQVKGNVVAFSFRFLSPCGAQLYQQVLLQNALHKRKSF